jgi:hypothetical protein
MRFAHDDAFVGSSGKKKTFDYTLRASLTMTVLWHFQEKEKAGIGFPTPALLVLRAFS